VSDTNKRNLVYFENPSMRGLYACMEEWQQVNNRRLLSVSIQQDDGNYCCIGLTNPTEVVITSADGNRHVDVTMWEARKAVQYSLRVTHLPVHCTRAPGHRAPGGDGGRMKESNA
jgi:hypothetical protein